MESTEADTVQFDDIIAGLIDVKQTFLEVVVQRCLLVAFYSRSSSYPTVAAAVRIFLSEFEDNDNNHNQVCRQ
jgi:hypothetical protein